MRATEKTISLTGRMSEFWKNSDYAAAFAGPVGIPQDVMETIDKKGVAYARRRFDECLAAPPVPELVTKEWLQRCQFPLGTTDEGKYFPLTD
jgi:hypothetical protein